MPYSLQDKVSKIFEQSGIPDITFIGSKIFVQNVEIGTLEGYITKDRLNRMISDFKRDHHG